MTLLRSGVLIIFHTTLSTLISSISSPEVEDTPDIMMLSFSLTLHDTLLVDSASSSFILLSSLYYLHLSLELGHLFQKTWEKTWSRDFFFQQQFNLVIRYQCCMLRKRHHLASYTLTMTTRISISFLQPGRHRFEQNGQEVFFCLLCLFWTLN